MKRVVILLMVASCLVCACVGKEPVFSDESNQKEEKKDDDSGKEVDPTPSSYTPTAEDLAVDRSLFELLDLSYAPLSEVKALYAEKKYKAAADSLLSYYKSKRKVVNSSVVLPVTSLTDKEWDIANQALPENGYRFYVASDAYYESISGGHYVFYSFSDGNGGINWEYTNTAVGREMYHKHHHPWFLYLGKAFAATKDEKYFNAWKSEYLDWLEKYPCPSTGKRTYSEDVNGYGWQSWHANTMASRITDLASTFEYFKSAKGFDFEWLTKFLTVYHELVTYSMANLHPLEYYNYRFSQYKAHCFASIFFPEFKTSTGWLRTVANQLSGYPDVSLLEDGCLNELDAQYHIGEAGGYYRVFVAARENNKMSFFKSDFLSKVEKACNFSVDYYYPNYLWECMNDVRQTTRTNARNSIYYFSEMFPENNKFKYMASYRQQGTEPTEKLCLYKNAGYYMLRSGWKESDMMVLYKNNYDYDTSSFGHIHFDNGTIGLYRNGRIFLPDAGCYTYGDKTGGSLDQAKAQMRLASSHNTVTKNGAAIAAANSQGKYLTSGEKDGVVYVVAENQSYPDLTHRRSVWMLDGKYIVVSDAAYGSSAGSTINISWHFGRDGILGENVAVYDDLSSSKAYGAHTVFTDGNNIFLKTFPETTTSFAVETGLSYMSEALLARYQRKYFRINVKKSSASETIRFITVIVPGSSDCAVSASYDSPSFTSAGEALTVSIDGKTYKLAYSITN